MLHYRNWPAGFRICIWLFAGFVLMAALVEAGRTGLMDERIIQAVQGAEGPGLTRIAEGLSLVGSSKLAVPISLTAMLVFYFALKHRMELIFFLWTCIGSYLLNIALKSLFRRDRPSLHRLIEEAGYSFPSGHAMASFSLYGALAFLLWRHMPGAQSRVVLIILALLMTGSIGWSRIYLGVHYPSDIIGGYLASGAWLMLSAGLFEFYRGRRREAAALRI